LEQFLRNHRQEVYRSCNTRLGLNLATEKGVRSWLWTRELCLFQIRQSKRPTMVDQGFLPQSNSASFAASAFPNGVDCAFFSVYWPRGF
jgi:hypothetical protein